MKSVCAVLYSYALLILLMPAYLVRESLLDEGASVDSVAAEGSPGGGSEGALHDGMRCRTELEKEDKKQLPKDARRHVGDGRGMSWR